jgi:hypothetical protein
MTQFYSNAGLIVFAMQLSFLTYFIFRDCRQVEINEEDVSVGFQGCNHHHR